MRHVFVATIAGAYLSLSWLAGTAVGQRERPKDVSLLLAGRTDA